MSTTETGHRAETAVCVFLVNEGYAIVARNWRLPTCEIDIIAWKDKQLFFIEVKYRQETSQGGGIDYITRPKLRRMIHAASAWTAINHWHGIYYLAAAGVSGKSFSVEEFIIID